jgi:hypothetical protein
MKSDTEEMKQKILAFGVKKLHAPDAHLRPETVSISVSATILSNH